MNVLPLLLFYSIGRIGFCAIHHNSTRLIRYEVVGSLFFLGIAATWVAMIDSFYNGGFIAFFFIVTALLPRRMAVRNQAQWVGIIDFVWLNILGITCGAILFARNFDILKLDEIPSGMRPEYYTQLASELNFLLGKAIDLAMILGSILAVCMTIIWSGEVWRKKGQEGEVQYSMTTRAAISMAYAYFIVLLSVAIWVCLPLYQNYTHIKIFLI